MDQEIFQMIEGISRKQELGRILACNDQTGEFGLTLTEEEAGQLLKSRRETLGEQRRVEMGESILPKIIMTFCDSPYIESDEYGQKLAELQEAFFLFKNESLDRVTDDELLEFMKEQFDGVCFGSVEYLEETCLERFAAAVRTGYKGYQKSQGRGVYSEISQETHWDRELYWAAMSELFG